MEPVGTVVMKPDNPIILALDYNNVADAENILSKVRPHIGMIKIGLELFTAYGREALDLADKFHVPIFLDLKLHDVPTTVVKTTEVVCSLMYKYPGEHFLSIHSFGGREMCEAAFKTAQGSNVQIAGVTTLTSMDDRDFRQLGFRDGRSGIRTIDAAYIAADCSHELAKWDAQRNRVIKGMTNLICAPNQLPLMRQHFGDDVVLIVPGIRSDSEESHDHARSKPASFALKNGATWIVVGRPITKAPDPVHAALYFKEQVDRYYER